MIEMDRSIKAPALLIQWVLSAYPGSGPLTCKAIAENEWACLQSAIRATIPGRQQRKNLGPALEAALAAYVRRLRRRTNG